MPWKVNIEDLSDTFLYDVGRRGDLHKELITQEIDTFDKEAVTTYIRANVEAFEVYGGKRAIIHRKEEESS